jgi:hypothetical protein
MNVTTWAKEFPFISDIFDMVSFDLIQLSDEENDTLYTILVRYVILDNNKEEVAGGVTVQTGMSGSTYLECAELLDRLVNIGFFNQAVSSYGIVYSEDMVKIDEIDWNNILLVSSTLIPEHTTLQ